MAYSISSGGGLLSNYSMNWYSIYKMDYMPVYGMNYAGYGSYSGGGGGGGGQTTQTFPTSAYGQTVPVLWGIGRVPGGYIWATDTRLENTGDGIRVLLSARLRFARPLVPDSRWSLRRMWSNGRKIYDATTGQKPSSIRFYDGHSSQGRDSRMVAVEGAENVSAHRGYLDVVLNNYNIGYVYGEGPNAIPAFEAEWVQDDTGSIDVDNTTGFFSDAVNTFPSADWDNGRWFGITTGTPNYLRVFDIGQNQEFFAIPISGLLAEPFLSISEQGFHYIPGIDRIVFFQNVPGFGGGLYPSIMDPSSGASLDTGGSIGGAGPVLNTTCVASFGSTGCLITSAFNTGYVATYWFDNSVINRTYLSAVDWDGRVSVVESMCVGTQRADDADIYLVGDDKLFKAKLTSNGFLINVTEIYSDADNLIYCVFHDGDVIVWTDDNGIRRIEPSDGSVVWTGTVPYQINASAALRASGPPCEFRLDGRFLAEGTTSYNFTDLDAGTTTTTSKSSSSVGRSVYDDVAGIAIKTDLTTVVARRVAFELAGDGTTRDLADFLTDLMVSGGFDASEVNVTGVDDQIRGAVIDITSGTREVARSVCEPYAIAMFERDGAVQFRRAGTD